MNRLYLQSFVLSLVVWFGGWGLDWKTKAVTTNQPPFVAIDFREGTLSVGGNSLPVVPAVLSGGAPIQEVQLWLHAPLTTSQGLILTNVVDSSSVPPYRLLWKPAPGPFEDPPSPDATSFSETNWRPR